MEGLLVDYQPDGRFFILPENELEDKLKTICVPLKTPRVAVDTETHYIKDDKKITRFLTKENVPNNTPFMLTISDGVKGYAVDINERTLPAIKDFLENPLIEKIFYSACYDLEMLLNEGIRVQGKIHDVLLLHHLVDEEDLDEEGNRIMDLKGLAVKYLTKDADKFEKFVDYAREEIAKERKIKKSEVTYYDVYVKYPLLMIDYASSDTLYTYMLFEKWLPELDAQELWEVYNIEMQCIWAVVDTEMRGYKIDQKRLAELEGELTTEVENITKEIFALVGKEFNIDSDEQLVDAFVSLGAEYHAITDKGNWKTDAEVLETYLTHHLAPVKELAEKVLSYRSSSKLLNTYIVNLKEFTQADGRVHPSFWQAGTRTGRMSSSKPNFQNIDPRAKCLFIPDDEYILVFMDASQQEYRLLAHYAKETSLIRMIEKGYDVHKATASLINNIPYEEITDEQRNEGKTVNFALVYGLGLAAIAKAFKRDIDEGKYKLANAVFRRLGLKPWKLPDEQTLLNSVKDEEEKDAIKYYFTTECKEHIKYAEKKKKEYFDRFPNIEHFLKQVKNVTQRRGWVKTWTGRRKRYKDPWKDAYKAPNAIIQGGCGDILKKKAAEVHQFLQGYKSGIVNFIHDSIDFEIHKSELHLIPQINAILRDLPFSVPIDWDIEYSTTCWADKKPLENLEELIKEVA